MTKHNIISRPQPNEYHESLEHYISIVPGNDLLAYFDSQEESVTSIAAALSDDQLLYRYAEGKWSVKDIFCHLIDTERIYCFRALSIARGEKQDLPGFEENDYAKTANAYKRNKESIIYEYKTVRAATIELFRNFDEEMLSRIGIANGSPRSVRSIGYMAAGHELHHLSVIREKYLSEP
jgi:hypothetical protein